MILEFYNDLCNSFIKFYTLLLLNWSTVSTDVNNNENTIQFKTMLLIFIVESLMNIERLSNDRVSYL